MRVLIVEDSPLLGQFLEKGLKQEGHSSVLVRDLKHAGLFGLYELPDINGL